MTLTEAPAGDTVLADLDPSTLVVDRNVRSKLGDLGPLVASIEQYGVLVPLIVVKENGGHRVVAGARRTAAAIKAKRSTVPCVIRTGIDADQALLEAQMIENLAREGLSATDEAKGYKQLAAFGLNEAQIATLTARPVDTVKAGLVVAASAPTMKAVAKHDLTLEQSAVLAEFADRADDFAELLRTATEQPGEWAWIVEELRSEKQRDDALTAARKKLTDDGVTVVDKRPGFNAKAPNCRISELSADGKTAFTAKTHAGCEGHAAYVEDSRHVDPTIIYLCTDPVKYEHKPHASTRSGGGESRVDNRTPEQKEADSAQRREVIAGNKAWKIATPVRLTFVQELCRRKSAPKGTLRFVTDEVLGAPHGLFSQSESGDDAMLAELLGVDPVTTKDNRNAFGSYGRHTGPKAVKDATDQRLPVLLFAQIAAARENTMGTHTWRDDALHKRSNPSAAKRYLAFLESVGYRLSDIEKRVP